MVDGGERRRAGWGHDQDGDVVLSTTRRADPDFDAELATIRAWHRASTPPAAAPLVPFAPIGTGP